MYGQRGRLLVLWLRQFANAPRRDTNPNGSLPEGHRIQAVQSRNRDHASARFSDSSSRPMFIAIVASYLLFNYIFVSIFWVFCQAFRGEQKRLEQSKCRGRKLVFYVTVHRVSKRYRKK